MSTQRTCIICGGPAGSAEHVFPAALGGRITNKGIYCGVHNKKFGKLVTRLQRQLAMMNAALEVRPDRSKEPKPFLFHHNGIRYSMLGADIDVDMPAPFDPDLVGEDGKYPLEAPSVEAAKRWIAENQSNEWRLELKDSRSIQQHYQTESVVIPLDFGGVDFLQSVGYIALTTFAQFFSAEARQHGLAAFKEMLQADLVADSTLWRDDKVWWDGRETTSVVGENPFEFGHVIAVGVCKATSRAHAYVSFFSCLSFGVDLGAVDPVSDLGSVKMFIDPTSDKAAGSITVIKDLDLNPWFVDKSITMPDMINSGSAAEAMGRLMEKIRLTHANKAAKDFEAKLPASLPNNPFQAIPILMEILKPHGQAVFNLIRLQIEFYIPKVQGREHVPEFLKSFIQGDDQQPNGLTPIASQAHHGIMMLIANHIHDEHLRGTLNASKIRDLLYGKAGTDLIHRFFVVPILGIAGFKLAE